jgi:hypothetical protein
MKNCKAPSCSVRKPREEMLGPMLEFCSHSCGYALANHRQRQAAERKRLREVREHRKRKESVKTRAGWAREAQTEFNAFTRARDSMLGCVSCGQSPNQGQRHASHYRSVAAASHLRFNTWNVHASCAQCNSMKSGNVVEYRIRLVNKIGSERVEALENNNEPRSFDIEYLRRVKRIFSRRARHYRKLRGMAWK